jgi:2',3'-cyclic-nucleotide 2'-phosphodiesterase/3'-nucleotidase
MKRYLNAQAYAPVRKGVKCFILLLLILLATVLISSSSKGSTHSEASQTETANLRFIFTTDIHGQLNNMDYETGKSYSIGGLTKAYTLIKEARKQLESSNSFTFDVGDTLFDYSTEYIFSESQKAIQPIYQAMATIGYDAITLGNHDFDYGFEYIKNQIEGSGLKDVTVVSNITDSKTGNPVWNENMLITRKVMTEEGNSVDINIGVIGETIPNLSKKTENYTGILKSEDIVENVKKQTEKLKSQGADIIVVLAHSGFGNQDPDLNYRNVSYAITQIPDVDVVLCGHEHNMFPNNDKTSSYYSLPGVDPATSLVNGKVLVMASDRGKSIGIADLSVKIASNGTVTIVDQMGQVKQVTSSTSSYSSLGNFYGAWEAQLLEYTKKQIATMKSGSELTSYFGYVEDSAALQLVNDAKMAYALNYINTVKTQYKDYPVIAASSYYKYGATSGDDYANVSGAVTESEISQIQTYNSYTTLYQITGKQLKEWLEWIASAYETLGKDSAWTDTSMLEAMQKSGMKSLVSQDWLANWSNFMVFDGIEYTINPNSLPRYDINGKKINDTNRITSLTYNGKQVYDTTKFILATERLSADTYDAIKGVDTQTVYRAYNRAQIIVSDYIRELAKQGEVKYEADNNWKLYLPYNYNFLVKSSTKSSNVASKESWYTKEVASTAGYSYYQGFGGGLSTNPVLPSLLLVSTNTQETNNNVTILVKASAAAGIKDLKIAYGAYDKDSSLWDSATSVVNNAFSVKENGTYSVFAQDYSGNRTVKQIEVTNISSGVLQAPKVNSYTNRKTKITGSAQANSTIHFIASSGQYETKVSEDGTFSYALPGQPSGTTVTVYVSDESGKISAKTTVKVTRTGPNQATVDNVTNTKRGITGITNDDDASMLAIVDNTVYVAKNGGKALFEASDLYNSKYKIVEVTQSIDEDLNFYLGVPLQKPKMKIVLYSMDHLSRASRSTALTVKDAGPYPPEINEVMDIEREISGNIASSKAGTIFDVYVTVGDNTYTGKTDQEGNYLIEVDKLNSGDTIKVYATDTVDGKVRKSYTTSSTVKGVSDFNTNGNSYLSMDDISNKMTSFCVYEQPNEEIFVSINKFVYSGVTDENGTFEITMADKLSPGTKVYAYTRFENGTIYEVEEATVFADVPMTPFMTNNTLTTHTSNIGIVTDEICTVSLKVGEEKYTLTTGTYDSTLGGYIYLFKVPRINSSEEVKAYAKNKVGYSKILHLTVGETAPNAPTVNKVNSDSKTITGKVHLIAPSNLAEDAEVTVANTETVVYAKIGSKTYEAKVYNTGTFKIKIPAQKAGTKIKVWASNSKGGVGPIRDVKVTK